MHIVVEGWPYNPPDRYWTTYAEDVVAGSRSPLFFDGYIDAWSKLSGILSGASYYHQRFSPTLIPYASAKGTQGPVQMFGLTFPYGTVPSPFNCADCWTENVRSGVADKMEAFLNVNPLLQRMYARTTCPLFPRPPPSRQF